jgi:hypothetical protein
MIRRAIAFISLIALLIHSQTPARACGPSYLQPIFVFDTSPDPPFQEFVAGNIGIVKPSFGRKTLLIAYRYLNGGSFNSEEQQQLIAALKGEPPEPNDDEPLKAWVAVRKEATPKDELPEIYTERKTPYEGYDYFPNCAKNAFEVATATLKDRITSYGADDRNVREWIRGQDQVFQNCSGGTASIPPELGPENSPWLRKDRDYQIAAAFFYSLQFDEALARFKKIAGDGESVWQATADYLVARTLVRKASLTDDAMKKAAVYTDAETQLLRLINGSNQFREASRKLLGLVKYRVRPEERATELAEAVSRPSASLDLRQDVIDYVWLLDKFEGQVLKEEHERQQALKPKEDREPPLATESAGKTLNDIIQRGELISVYFSPKFADGTSDYHNSITVQVKPDTPESEILKLVEARANRTLSDDESNAIKNQIKSSVNYSRWLTSYNLKLSRATDDYGGCYYCWEEKMTLAKVPAFLLRADLTDWIFTVELEDASAYSHALAKWRETDSPAWLAAALIKAEPASPDVRKLISAAERIAADSRAFPTIAFELIRLKTELGETKAAQQLLDTVMTTQFDLLPRSAQNELQAQYLQLAGNLAQFLRYAARKPVAFYDEGMYTTIRELFEDRKSLYEDYEDPGLSKAEYLKRLETEYRDLLADDLKLFDDDSADIVDRHFSLKLLTQAAGDPQLSAFLQHRLTFAVWTRALLLHNYEIAIQVAPSVKKLSPEITPLMKDFLEAKNPSDREHAALYLLLKSSSLTPFVAGNLNRTWPGEDLAYYFESAWWCAPSETAYRNGQEVQKVVNAPPFIDRQQLAAAKDEYEKLAAIGDAKTYLGKQVLAWAKTEPNDPRIPEALFIAFKANESYKYGCNGWEHDEEIQKQTEELLRERYPASIWNAKLDETRR